MGKHRHKKSFYDVDEDELEPSRKHQHRHHHHRSRRRHHSSDKQDETKQRVPSISSFNNSKIDDDEVALLSPPVKRQRSSSNGSQSPSKILSQFIENPDFLANAGPKAKEFAETARQLLAKPDLDLTTQQIICAMAQVRFLFQEFQINDILFNRQL
jgi:ssDNA-specific exonuclease RecJ